MIMYAGYLAASWETPTAGLTLRTGTTTVRLGPGSVSARCTRAPSLALSTCDPSRPGTFAKPPALARTVASRGKRFTAERTCAVRPRTAACE